MNETPLFQVRNRGPVFWVVKRVNDKWQPMSGHYQTKFAAEQFIDQLMQQAFRVS